jgi:multiple sugar transport system substrate-binding protein
MRKPLTLVLVLALMLSLTASAPAALAAEGGKTLVFWDMPWGGADYTAEAQRLVAQYTKETGQKVEYQQIPWDGWIQTFVTAVTSNTGPDVTTGGALLQHRLALMNEIEPLDDLAANYKAEDFVPGTLENFRYDNKQIAIPFNCDFRAIAYRTDIFQADGVDKLPTTWDEFYEAAKKLTHGDQYGYVTSGSDASAHWTLMFWSVMNGGAYLDDNMNPCMASNANVQAMDFLRRMYADGILPPGVAGYASADADKLFYQGAAAMIMATPGIGSENVSPEVKEKIAILPPLTSPAGLKQNVGSTNGIMLLADSQLKAEGKAFIDWWSKNSLTLWTVGKQGPFPARLSLLGDAYFQNDPIKKQFADIIVPSTVLLTYPHKEARVEMDVMDGEQFYRDVIQELYTTDTDAMTILQGADERYAAALEQMRSAGQ